MWPSVQVCLDIPIGSCLHASEMKVMCIAIVLLAISLASPRNDSLPTQGGFSRPCRRSADAHPSCWRAILAPLLERTGLRPAA